MTTEGRQRKKEGKMALGLSGDWLASICRTSTPHRRTQPSRVVFSICRSRCSGFTVPRLMGMAVVLSARGRHVSPCGPCGSPAVASCSQELQRRPASHAACWESTAAYREALGYAGRASHRLHPRVEGGALTFGLPRWNSYEYACCCWGLGPTTKHTSDLHGQPRRIVPNVRRR